MAGFSFDPQLFNSAIKKMESAESSFSGINGLISDVSSKFPKNYEYKSIVSTACDDLSVASTFVSNYIKTLNHTNEDLAEKFLDPTSNIKNFDLLDHLGDIFSDTGAFWQGKVFSSLRGDILNYINLLKMTGATIFVFDTTVLGAVANVGEVIFDGAYAVNGFLGAAGAKIHDLFYGTNTSSEIMDNTLDFLRRDLVGEAKTNFYNTKVGKSINDASLLKYDSELAKKIESVSEFATKVAAATGATVLTGGVAAPVFLGALYGTGKKLETYSNKVDRENGENYNYTEAILKGVSGGVTGAMEWWGYGGLGSFALNGVKALSAFKAAGGSLSLSGIRNAAPLIRKSVALRDFGKNYFKELFAKDNIIDSSSVITDDLLDYYYGDITKAELVKDVKWELGLGALLSSVGSFGRSLEFNKGIFKNELLSELDNLFKSKHFEQNADSFILKHVDGDYEIPKKLLFDYEKDNGLAFSEYMFRQGYNTDLFNQCCFEELENKINTFFRTNELYDNKKIDFADVKCNTFDYNGRKYLKFNGLEPQSAYKLKTSVGIDSIINVDITGSGYCFWMNNNNITEPEMIKLIFNSDIVGFELFSELDDFNKYVDMLGKSREGSIGINQGCLNGLLNKLDDNGIQILKKVSSIVNKNIPSLSKSDALFFVNDIDKVGVCDYASPLNNMIINSNIVKNPDVFEYCFGYPLFDSNTGLLNQELLLADFYSYVNRNNTNIFRIDSDGNRVYNGVPEHDKNQIMYLGPKWGYYDGYELYENQFFVDWFNSKLSNGLDKYGQDIYEYRPILDSKGFSHKRKFSPGWTNVSKINDDSIIGLNGEVNKTVSLKNSDNPLKGTLKNNAILNVFPSETEPIFMYNLTENDFRYCEEPHSMLILDELEDGFVVQSWGDIFFVDYTNLNNFDFDIIKMKFNN